MPLFGKQASNYQTTDELEFEGTESMESSTTPQSEANKTTVISNGITVSGTIEGEGNLRVEGCVDGEIKLEGEIVVAASGKVKGPINAAVVTIAGNVEGNITSHGKLHLERTGSILGDVTTEAFVIDSGGVLNGKTSMIKEAIPNILKIDLDKASD